MTSAREIPAAHTRISTSPSRGCGFSRSATRSTPGPPGSDTSTTRTRVVRLNEVEKDRVCVAQIFRIGTIERVAPCRRNARRVERLQLGVEALAIDRSEEHTSE